MIVKLLPRRNVNSVKPARRLLTVRVLSPLTKVAGGDNVMFRTWWSTSVSVKVSGAPSLVIVGLNPCLTAALQR